MTAKRRTLLAGWELGFFECDIELPPIPPNPMVKKAFTGVRAFGLKKDQGLEFTIFNVGGNKYRLATYIHYRTGKVYIRHVMTHAEYSREDWKKR